MDAVPGTLSLPPVIIPPCGLGTGQVESLSGYVSRMSARIAVPAPTFARRVFQHLADESAFSVVRPGIPPGRRLNIDDPGPEVAAAIAPYTDNADLTRLSYFAFLDLFGLGDRGDRRVLAINRRWCPGCWRTDDPERYERKVWWLNFVDVCHVHRCLLESRCVTCGRLQPALPRGVRLYVCSYCGHDLAVSDLALSGGSSFERMLWYAREGDLLVHAGEAIAVSRSDERASLESAYRRLAELARARGLLDLEQFFADQIHRAAASKLEHLMSALWRLQVGVVELFSPAVRTMVDRPGRPEV